MSVPMSTPSSGNTGATRNNNQSSTGGAGSGGAGGGGGGLVASSSGLATVGGSASSRPPHRPRGRVLRAIGRGRGQSVIVGSRPMVPASVVPEDLINQVRVYMSSPPFA